MITRLFYALFVIFAMLLAVVSSAQAQDLEPRAYSNAPVGMSFLLLGYQNSSGALLFDPAIPVTDADANVDMGFIGYVRVLDVAGKSAKAGLILPYATLSADGYLNGDYLTREQTGLADPALYFSMNLYGAPALSIKEFSSYRQDTIIGFSMKVTAPLGAYQSEKVINIGNNRWSVKPELGISQALGKWTVEAAAAATVYTDNNEFERDKTRSQEPIYSTQLHLIYAFPGNIWASVGATYYTGGRTTIDGITRNDLQQNWRSGFTLSLPINRKQSLKLYGNSGVSTRTGTDYDSIGIVWQYRWARGF